MRQELLLITGRQKSHDVPDHPKALWLVTPGRHKIPFVLVHRVDAFLEDEMHDWHWRSGRLWYHGAGETPCWVVLEYD